MAGSEFYRCCRRHGAESLQSTHTGARRLPAVHARMLGVHLLPTPTLHSPKIRTGDGVHTGRTIVGEPRTSAAAARMGIRASTVDLAGELDRLGRSAMKMSRRYRPAAKS
jgi:hypothetical protein